MAASILSDTTGTGGEAEWRFSVQNDDIAFLTAGESIVETWAVEIENQDGQRTEQFVEVTINGTAEVAAETKAEVLILSRSLPDLGFTDNLLVSGLSKPPTVTTTAGNPSRDGVEADVDGDGDLDAVIVNSPLGSIEVLLNTGSAFTATIPEAFAAFGPGMQADAVNAGAFDADAYTDLVIGGSDGQVVFYSSGADGTTDAGFVTAGTQVFDDPNGVDVRAIEVGDIDGDGDLDVAVLRADTSGGTVAIYSNDGSGLFAETIRSAELGAIGRAAFQIHLFDTDGDGIKDVLLSNNQGIGATEVVSGADGASNQFDVFATGGANAFASGDLNGDGFEDLVFGTVGALGGGNPGGLQVLFGTETGYSDTPVEIDDLDLGLGTAVLDIDLADLDGDGDLDIAAALFGANDEPGATVLIEVSQNATVFERTVVEEPHSPRTIVAADFFDLGADDLVL
jgi:hypothetical protein